MIFDLLLDETNLMIVGILFGLFMVAPYIADIIIESTKKGNDE